MMGHLKALLLAALVSLANCGPVIVRDTPASLPALTAFRYSGSGCTQGSNSVKRDGGWSDATFTFSDFTANSPGEDATENCEVHYQGSGASAGWQVSVSELNVNGKVVLPPEIRFNYYWQIYWSDDAPNTVGPVLLKEECLILIGSSARSRITSYTRLQVQSLCRSQSTELSTTPSGQNALVPTATRVFSM